MLFSFSGHQMSLVAGAVAAGAGSAVNSPAATNVPVARAQAPQKRAVRE